MAGFYDKTREQSERRTARWLPSIAGFVIGFIVIIANARTMVQVKVAPRVVLVEMVRDLIAGNVCR